MHQERFRVGFGIGTPGGSEKARKGRFRASARASGLDAGRPAVVSWNGGERGDIRCVVK